MKRIEIKENNLNMVYEITDENEIKLLHFSNLSWWINGRGTWYVSLIILLYLLSPFLYFMLYNTRFKWLYLAITSFILMILCQDDNYTWFWYGSNALKRSPSFLIGMAIAKYVQEGK